MASASYGPSAHPDTLISLAGWMSKGLEPNSCSGTVVTNFDILLS